MARFNQTRYIAMVKRNTVPASFRYGYSVYTPASDDGIWWTNWHMMNLRGGATHGCIRLVEAKLARLCKSTRYSLVFNDPARTGVWAAITPSTINDIDGVYCLGTTGQTVTYTVVIPAGGRIIWEWISSAVSTSEAYVVIRNSAGEEIALYDIPVDDGGHRYVDMYSASEYNEIYRTSLASNLPSDTYTVLITASGINGAGGGARVYERYCFAVNDALPGDPAGTDPWLDQASPTRAFGIGNVEYAGKIAQSGAPYADLEFCSGVHGYESDPTGLVMLVDGTNIKEAFDLATTYQGTKWFARVLSFQHRTTVWTRVGLVNQATIDWQQLFTAAGYDCNLLRTTLIATDYGPEYVGMNMCPNLANGGTDMICVGAQAYRIGSVTPDVQVNYYPNANRSGVSIGSGWQASVLVAAPADLEAVYPHANEHSPKTLLTDRPDGYVKDYRAVIYPESGVMVPVAAGDVLGVQMQFRVKKA